MGYLGTSKAPGLKASLQSPIRLQNQHDRRFYPLSRPSSPFLQRYRLHRVSFSSSSFFFFFLSLPLDFSARFFGHCYDVAKLLKSVTLCHFPMKTYFFRTLIGFRPHLKHSEKVTSTFLTSLEGPCSLLPARVSMLGTHLPVGKLLTQKKKKKKLYESLRITFSIATRRKLFHTS